LPEASGGIAGALQNDGIVAHDADGFGVETSLESMIAELANGKEGMLLYWSNPVSQVLRAMAFKRTTRGRSNFGELMTA
jgi:hypothetical protein